MTKKDYILLADAIGKVASNLGTGANTMTGPQAIELVIRFLISALEDDNPRFDAQRFSQRINKKG